MAQTHSPMRSVDESPSGATGRFDCPSTFSSAMSVSGSAPTTRARSERPSDSFTRMRSAPSMTWLLVRILPSASTMKPLPEPRRGASRERSNISGASGSPRRLRRRESAAGPALVASMFTTAAFTRSTTSAKFTNGAPAVRGAPIDEPTALTAARRGALMVGCAPRLGRRNPPATIAPTRNATTAVRATVTNVNRLDISAGASL